MALAWRLPSGRYLQRRGSMALTLLPSFEPGQWVNVIAAFSSRRDDYFTCDVLWISDPLPPTVLTESQQAEYFRLLDKRYSAMQAYMGERELHHRSELGVKMALGEEPTSSHGALAIHCHWPSYRTEQASK